MRASPNPGPPVRPLARRVGIFQGRLVTSVTGELQCSPGDRWAEEFRLAGTLGLSHVELLGERVPDPANPIWSSEGRARMAAVADEAGIELVSLCSEEPLEVPLADGSFSAALAARLEPVARELHLGVIVLPMYEASDCAALPWAPVADGVRRLAEAVQPHGTRVALELALTATDSLRFLEQVGGTNVGLCYDVGNATAMGCEPAREIPVLGTAVGHVHAKDKDADGANVRFGTGRVDFAAAFSALRVVGYSGAVTIEATRGDDPVVTAAEHRAFLLALD